MTPKTLTPTEASNDNGRKKKHFYGIILILDNSTFSGIFSLEMRRLWGDLIASFLCLKEGYKKDVEIFYKGV